MFQMFLTLNYTLLFDGLVLFNRLVALHKILYHCDVSLYSS